MEVPLSVVLYILQEFGPIVLNMRYLRPDTFTGFLFLEDGKGLDPTYLYACTAAEFSRLAMESLMMTFLCFGSSEEDFRCGPKNRSTLILFPLEKMGQVLNKLTLTFAELQRWEKELENYALSGTTVQEMVNISERLFTNPFLILDSSHKVIAVGKNQLSRNRYFIESVSNGFLPVWFLKSILDRGFMSLNKFYSGITTMAKPNLADSTLLICSISPTHYRHGYFLQFCECKQPSDYERFLIRILLSQIEKRLQKVGTTLDRERNYDDHLIEELLDQTYTKSELLAERAKLAGLSVRGHYQLFIVVMERDFIHQIGRVGEALKALGFHYKIGIYKGDAILLRNICTHTDLEERVADDLNHIHYILKNYNAKIGVSDEFTELSSTHNAYIQAKFAIKLGALQDQSLDVYFYDDYYAYHICAICAEQVELYTLVYGPLRHLIDHDSRTNSNDVELLEIFLSNNCNASEVAKVMNLHRNSVHYRIRRMEEIMGIRIEQSNARFRLLSSIYFLRYMKWRTEEKDMVIQDDF